MSGGVYLQCSACGAHLAEPEARCRCGSALEPVNAVAALVGPELRLAADLARAIANAQADLRRLRMLFLKLPCNGVWRPLPPERAARLQAGEIRVIRLVGRDGERTAPSIARWFENGWLVEFGAAVFATLSNRCEVEVFEEQAQDATKGDDHGGQG